MQICLHVSTFIVCASDATNLLFYFFTALYFQVLFLCGKKTTREIFSMTLICLRLLLFNIPLLIKYIVTRGSDTIIYLRKKTDNHDLSQLDLGLLDFKMLQTNMHQIGIRLQPLFSRLGMHGAILPCDAEQHTRLQLPGYLETRTSHILCY